MALEDYGQLAEAIYVQLLVLALATARAFGLMVMLPIFTRLGISGLIRNGVVVAIALPLVPYLADQVGRLTALPMLLISALLVKEALLGMLLGLVFAVPFWAAESAGSLIEFQRGSTAAFLIDPTPTEDPTITSTLFVILALVLFYVSTGLTIVLDGLYRSYDIWPATEFLPQFSEQGVAGLLALLDRVLSLALLIAGPILIIMLIVDFVLGFIGRSAQQLNIFDLSFAFKGLAFVLVMPLYIGFLIGHVDDIMGTLGRAIDQIRLFFP